MIPPPKAALSFSTRLRAHVAIARLDHATKNIFILPGIVIPLTAAAHPPAGVLARNILLGTIACTLVASSNYVLNELLDAPHDRLHPGKRNRPCAAGLVNTLLAYLEWLVLMILGLWAAWTVSSHLAWACASLWVMGSLYNIPPIRTKEIAYVDVLSESINNPIRLLIGWYMVTDTMIPPVSLLACYWLMGAYFMALKRFSEYRAFASASLAAAYRRSFLHYSERSVLVSVLLYGSAGMLFFGAFIARYRLELILGFPFVAAVMAVYMLLSFQPDSPVQHPESLYREPALMIACSICAAVLSVLMVVDIPAIHGNLTPAPFDGFRL